MHYDLMTLATGYVDGEADEKWSSRMIQNIGFATVACSKLISFFLPSNQLEMP